MFTIGETLERVIYPALWHRLATAFPEFGFVQKKNNYFQATKKEHTKTLPGAPRPNRVHAYQNAPFGFKIHGGDFISWLQYLNNMQHPKRHDFIRCARKLFELVGEPFPEKETSPQVLASIAQRERKQALWEAFWSFCQQQLLNPQNSHVLKYARKRGLTDEKIELHLGYYPTPKEVKNHLLNQGFTQAEIGYPHNEVADGRHIASAVLYDGRWQGRLIGAWRNKAGRLINFWARDLSGKAKDNEKYLMLKNAGKDSPYGLDLVRGSEAILVEGFLDAMPLWPDVPAISLGGAAISDKQIEAIAQAGIDSLTINLDYDGPDGAGHKGTMQVIEALLKHKAPFQAYVIAPEEMSNLAKPLSKMDPNDYVLQNGLAKYKNLLDQSQKAICYLTNTILGKHNLTTDKGKSKAIAELLRYDNSIFRETDREDMWKLVAKHTGYSLPTLLLQTKSKGKADRQFSKKLQEIEKALPIGELLNMYGMAEHDPLSQTDIFTAYQEITGCKEWDKVVNHLSQLAETYKDRMESVGQIPEEYFTADLDLRPDSPLISKNLAEELHQVMEQQALMLHAGTGVGKTYQILLQIILNLEKGESSTLFCSNLTEARRAIAMLKKLLPGRHNFISLNVSSNILDGDPDEAIHQKIKVARIAVSTYAYLGLMGNTGRLYKIAPLLIKGRNVYCDEPQELWSRTKVNEPLAARYLLRLGEKGKGTYNMQHRCPYSSKKGNCRTCFMAYLHTALDYNNEREFYRKISEKAFAEHLEKPSLGNITWESLQNPDNYQQISGNLFYQHINQEPKYDLADFDFDHKAEPNKGKSYEEYFQTLVSHTHNAHFRIQYPLLKENGTEVPILPETIIRRQKVAEEHGLKYKDKIQFPIHACSIPTLSGINLIPYLQLFSEAKRLVFASATIPEDMRDLLHKVAKNHKWQCREVAIDEVPFTFTFTALKMEGRLSLERQTKITQKVEAATDNKTKMLLVTSKKSEAIEVYGHLKNILPEKVRLFLRQDFVSMVELEYTSPLYNQKGKITVIYAWSALSRGADMPDVVLVIVDCSQFIPQAGLSDINPLMSKEEIYQSLLKEIAQNLTQILGRLMRSLKERVAGQTVVDERNIVMLLHGLPKELMDFRIDERFIHQWTEYRNDIAKQKSFVSVMESHINDSIVDAVLACLEGKEPANQFELDRERLKEKAQNKGIEMLSENQRDMVKQDEQKLTIEERAKQAAQNNITWTEFYRKESGHRLPKLEQKKLKKIFI